MSDELEAMREKRRAIEQEITKTNHNVALLRRRLSRIEDELEIELDDGEKP